MSAPTIAEQTARDQRLARALEQLVEMGGTIGIATTPGVGVACMDRPPCWSRMDIREQRAWLVANPVVYAKPGDPEDIARAIGEAHANWKASST